MHLTFRRWVAGGLALFPAIVGAVVLLLSPAGLRAQSLTSGDIAGVVTDSTGAALPGVDVKATDLDTGAVKSVKTGAAGDYRISLLQPGHYSVTATAHGFEVSESNLTLNVSEVAPQNFKLMVGKLTQTVEVRGAAVPLLQPDTSELSTTMTAQQVKELPNPGGDITYPVNLSPGVIMNTQGEYGNSEAFGLPATSNNFTVNGAEDNDPFLNLNNSGPSNLLLGQNDVDQISVVSNAYGAQYGELGGIQENILTRSGTNQFHGNVVYYWTNSDINANQWFNDNTDTPLAYANANQGAGAIGGPIVKDKLFFFVNFETLRFVTSVPTQVVIPSPAYENAVISNLQNTGQTDQVQFYQNIFNTYNAAPGASAATPYNGTTYADSFEGNPRTHLTENMFTARVDWKEGPNDLLMAHMKYDHGVQPTYTDPIDSNFDADSNQPDWEGQLQETHTFSPNLVNQANFSTMYYSAIFVNTDPAAILALTPYALTWSDGSFNAFGGAESYAFPQGRNVTQYQINDDVSWTKGKHTIKFGFFFKRDDTTDEDPQELSQVPLASEYGPASVTPSAATTTPPEPAGENQITTPLSPDDDFGNGVMYFAEQSFPQKPSAPIAQYNLSFYAQDEWRVSPNFEVTAGLRVEHNSNPVCQTNCFGRFASAYNNVTAGLNTPYNSVIDSGLHQTFNGLQGLAFDPRIGFTLSPPDHPQTLLRGGFGMFTDIFPATAADDLLFNPPFSASFSSSGIAAPGLPGSVNTNLVNDNATFVQDYPLGYGANQMTASDPGFSAPNLDNPAPNIKYPTYLEYSLQLQQQVGRYTSFQIGYVGNHGYHEPWLNNGVNMYSTAGFGGVPTAPALPAFAEITEIESSATSNYNGLLASLKYQSRFVMAQINYTWSHSLDEISNGGFLPFGEDSGGNTSPTTIDPFNLKLQNYGNADYDIRNSMNANYLINVPYFGGPRVLTDNWIIGGVVFWHSGFPFSVFDSAVTSSFAPNYGGKVLADIVPGTNVPRHCTLDKSNPDASCFGNTTANGQISPYFANPVGFGDTMATPGSSGVYQRRNQFVGPGYFDTDFTMMKGFKIPHLESGLFQIGVEAYNVLNHSNFFNPDTNFSAGAGFGTITETVSPPTSAFGSFLGGNSSARIVQLKANIKF